MELKFVNVQDQEPCPQHCSNSHAFFTMKEIIINHHIPTPPPHHGHQQQLTILLPAPSHPPWRTCPVATSPLMSIYDPTPSVLDFQIQYPSFYYLSRCRGASTQRWKVSVCLVCHAVRANLPDDSYESLRISEAEASARTRATRACDMGAAPCCLVVVGKLCLLSTSCFCDEVKLAVRDDAAFYDIPALMGNGG
eukprot:768724-Hanusia_phi.AAC.8